MALGTSQWLADQLIRSIRRRAYMPANDEVYSSADLLEVINEELVDYVVPFLRTVNEKHLVRRYDTVITTSTEKVRIPPRAAGEALEGVYLQVASTGDFLPVQRLETAKAPKVDAGFTIEDDVLYLRNLQAGTLRLAFFWRPSKVVLAASCAQIVTVAFNSGGYDPVNVGASLGNVASSTTAAVDVVAGQPGFRARGFDLVCDTLTAFPVFEYFPVGTLPTDTVPGDYLCAAGEAPYAQIPTDAQPLLAQRCAVKLLEGKGGENYDRCAAELEGARGRAMDLLKPRTQANPTYVHNFDGPAWRLRGARGVPR